MVDHGKPNFWSDRATTHWSSLARLAELGGVEVVQERVVRDGHIWTVAGVSAGIDMALASIESAAGEAVAGRIQFGAEYCPSCRRYGDLDPNNVRIQLALGWSWETPLL